jgi:hypothetical protein
MLKLKHFTANCITDTIPGERISDTDPVQYLEFTFEPDDGYIGPKRVVQQNKTAENRLCSKVTK